MWGDLHCRLLPQVQGIVRNDDVSIDTDIQNGIHTKSYHQLQYTTKIFQWIFV